MQLHHLPLDASLRERTVRGVPGYPVAVYDNDMEGFLGGSVPWHWHGEIEFAFVRHGRMLVETEGRTEVLPDGDGIFFNSGVLHRMARADGAPCSMVTVDFNPLLISGAETSLLHGKYVLPLLRCRGLPVVRLEKGVPWQGRVLRKLEEVFACHRSGLFGGEFLVRQLLTEIWMELLQAHRTLLQESGGARENPRLKQMLQYLGENMQRPLRLEDVAGAAGVSTRECTRCFRRALGMSPMAYLTQLRIRAAAALLERTEDPVTDIGGAVGFGSPSYFGKVFSMQTGLAPREYRRQARGGRGSEPGREGGGMDADSAGG